MKTYIPTIGLIASLAFGCASSLAQQPKAVRHPVDPVTATAPATAANAASSEEDFAAATDAALAAGEKAFETQNEALAGVNDRLLMVGRGGRASTSTRSLFIPKDAADAKSLSETEEDMSVMARILDKAASGKPEKGERHANSFGWGFGGSTSAHKNLYIDGYGALFFITVNFPLLPPATKEKATEPKSETDSEWEKTRNELLHPQGTSSEFNYNFELFDSSNPFGSSGPAEEYDEEKVTELKENLTAALKNASHIRRLKGDDSVTLVVTGRSPVSAPKAATTRKSQNNSFNPSSSATTWVTTSRAGSQPPAARLVIRAKRSDIESFQKDKLSADDFRKKVTMFIY